jgi:hypothetical protein
MWLIKLPNLSERERDRICTMAFGLLILLLEQMNINCWDFDDPTGPSLGGVGHSPQEPARDRDRQRDSQTAIPTLFL